METKQIYTSLIHWFGSYGKNYGFIVRPEDIDSFSKMSKYEKYEQGYYFDEENIIDQQFLDYLKQDKKHGEGIYIQFDLITRKNGKSAAINVQLSMYIGTVDKISKNYTFDSKIKCEDDSLIDFRNDHYSQLKLDDIVAFGVRNKNNRCEAILIDKIEDENTICDYINSNNPTIFIKSLIAHINLNILSLEEIESKIIDKKTLLTSAHIQLRQELAQKIPSIYIKYADLRYYLINLQEYPELVNQYINDLDKKFQDGIVQELIDKMNKNGKKLIDDYWNKIEYLSANLEYKGYLWGVAPKEYKLKKIQERYQIFFDLVKQFAESGYPDEHKICDNWQELYSLNQEEQELIKKWTGKDLDDEKNYDELEKMVAARGAEKLVVKYYESLGYNVEDTSIQQIQLPASISWEKYDIKITKEKQVIFLDVKSARSSKYSKIYSSFCVKKLKESRQQDIKIIGVLSSVIDNNYQVSKDIHTIHIRWYFANKLNEEQKRKLEEDARKFLEKKYPSQNIIEDYIINWLHQQKITIDNNDKFEQIKILGTFDKSNIIELKRLFLGKELESIDIIKETPGKENNTYYPHWLFDYDDDFYLEQIKIIEEFRNLTNEEIPSYQEFNLIEKQYNPLPLFIAAQRELPNNWREALSEWECKFIDSIINLDIKSQRIKLPHIFLAILKHFLSMIRTNSSNQDYSPQQYLKILYTHQNLHEDPHPLKIYDPVKDQHPNSSKESPTIINFCETLNILYSGRENLKLNEFVKFHFQGRGLLEGKKLGSNEKARILAYCGKCGYPHIIRNEEPGKNNICKSNTCKYLICPKCKCCKRDCSEYKKRTEEKQNPVDILGLNVVHLVGRVGEDPDVRYFDDGNMRCNLSLAVKRRNKKYNNDDKPDWFKLKLWGKTAEIANNHVRKGRLIGVQGSLIFGIWDDKTKANSETPIIQVEKLHLYD